MVANAGCCASQGIITASPQLRVFLLCSQSVVEVSSSCFIVLDPFTQEPLNATVRQSAQVLLPPLLPLLPCRNVHLAGSSGSGSMCAQLADRQSARASTLFLPACAPIQAIRLIAHSPAHPPSRPPALPPVQAWLLASSGTLASEFIVDVSMDELLAASISNTTLGLLQLDYRRWAGGRAGGRAGEPGGNYLGSCSAYYSPQERVGGRAE